MPHLRCCKEGTGKIYLLGPSRKAVATSGNFRGSICLLGTNHILLKVLSKKRHLSLLISAFKVWTLTELMALYRRCTERVVHIKRKTKYNDDDENDSNNHNNNNNNNNNHNYNKILKSDWLSTALISALIGQLNRTVLVISLSNWTVRAITCALKWLFFSLVAKKSRNFLCFD